MVRFCHDTEVSSRSLASPQLPPQPSQSQKPSLKPRPLQPARLPEPACEDTSRHHRPRPGTGSRRRPDGGSINTPQLVRRVVPHGTVLGRAGSRERDGAGMGSSSVWEGSETKWTARHEFDAAPG